MITEDFVSFEIAKLLKENGFDEECSCFYDNIDYGTPGLEVDGKLYYKNSALDDEEYAAPTLQMAMKWLREVHNIFIQVELYSKYNDYWFELFQNTHRLMIECKVYNSYEEVCEAAIEYCLENLI